MKILSAEDLKITFDDLKKLKFQSKKAKFYHL